MKSRTASFEIDVFRSTFFISVGDTISEAVLALPKEFHDSNMPEGAGLMLHDGGGWFAVAFCRKHLDSDVVAHELFHVTIDMLDRLSIGTDTDHDETGAHLMGYLTGITTKQLKKWGYRL